MKKKIILYLLGGLAAVIVLFLGITAVGCLRAKNIAENYLQNKYSVEMTHRITVPPIFPFATYTSHFYSDDNPSIEFSVEILANECVNDSISDRLEKDQNVLYTHDDYLTQRFKTIFDSELKENVMKSWPDCSVKAEPVNYYAHNVTLSENTDFYSSERLVEYSIYISAYDMPDHEAYELVHDVIEFLNDNKFVPQSVVLSQQVGDEKIFTEIENW